MSFNFNLSLLSHRLNGIILCQNKIPYTSIHLLECIIASQFIDRSSRIISVSFEDIESEFESSVGTKHFVFHNDKEMDECYKKMTSIIEDQVHPIVLIFNSTYYAVEVDHGKFLRFLFLMKELLEKKDSCLFLPFIAETVPLEVESYIRPMCTHSILLYKQNNQSILQIQTAKSFGYPDITEGEILFDKYDQVNLKTIPTMIKPKDKNTSETKEANRERPTLLPYIYSDEAKKAAIELSQPASKNQIGVVSYDYDSNDDIDEEDPDDDLVI